VIANYSITPKVRLVNAAGRFPNAPDQRAPTPNGALFIPIKMVISLYLIALKKTFLNGSILNK